MNTTFVISATTPAGRTLTTTTDNPGAAFGVAKLFAEDHADPAKPVQWQVDPDAPGLVETLVRVDDGPTHLILLAPGQSITSTTELETCCAATLQLGFDHAEVYSVRGGVRGIPCPLCHTAWAARYQQLTNALAVSA